MDFTRQPTVRLNYDKKSRDGSREDLFSYGPRKLLATSQDDLLEAALTECNNYIANEPSTFEGDCDVVLSSTVKLADLLRAEQKFTLSLTLLSWSVDVCDRISDPALRLKKMNGCGRGVWSVALSIKKRRRLQRQDIKTYAMPILELLLQKIRLVQFSNVQAEAEAWCLYYNAACYHYIGGEEQNVLHYSIDSRYRMNNAFGDNASKWRVVGLSHAISAVAYHKLKNHTLAIHHYECAIKVFESAEDMSEFYKKSCINHEKAKIMELRQSLFCSTLPKRICCMMIDTNL